MAIMKKPKTKAVAFRVPQKDVDFLCKIGNGNKTAGLRKLLFCYANDDNQRLRDAYDHIKELEKVIEDKKHIIKALQKIIDQLDA
jgi:hypothetical protein